MSISSLFSLRGRTALITGASQGIGAAIATTFAEAGANLVLHHKSDHENIQPLADRLSGKGGAISVIESDFSSPQGAVNLAKSALTGRNIDVLVINASVQILQPWTEITAVEVTAQFDVNYRSSLELLQSLMPSMSTRGWGRVLMIGSVQELKPHPEMLVYSSLKSAQMGIVRSLAAQLAPRGITVNSIAPGVVTTVRNRDRLKDEAYHAKVVRSIPSGRIGSPADIMGAALLLCSDAGAYITGQRLGVDGGMGL